MTSFDDFRQYTIGKDENGNLVWIPTGTYIVPPDGTVFDEDDNDDDDDDDDETEY